MKRPAAVALLFLAASCAAPPPAPVVEMSERPGAGIPSRILTKDGKYRVRRGDTLHAIAFSFGLDHRDIARWNGIRAPYTIFQDQLLRMTPPPATPESVVSARPTASQPATKPATRKPSPGVAESPPAKTMPVQRSPESGADPKQWRWPVEGRLLRGYSASDPSRNGLDIAGREGQPVRASAAGKVVYSGNGLIGYGELIIIKHSERMLSAYAHNRVRMVSEGADVEAGQQIAELGRNDRNEQILHFEIRVNGRPINPLDYLPRQ